MRRRTLTFSLALSLGAFVVLGSADLRAEQFETVILRIFGGDSGSHGDGGGIVGSQGGSVVANHPGGSGDQGDSTDCEHYYGDQYGDSYGDHCTPIVIDDSNYGGIHNDPSSVPEPGTLALLGLGAAAAGAYRLRRRKKALGSQTSNEN